MQIRNASTKGRSFRVENFDFLPGNPIALSGANNSGKTALLKEILLGFEIERKKALLADSKPNLGGQMAQEKELCSSKELRLQNSTLVSALAPYFYLDSSSPKSVDLKATLLSFLGLEKIVKETFESKTLRCPHCLGNLLFEEISESNNDKLFLISSPIAPDLQEGVISRGFERVLSNGEISTVSKASSDKSEFVLDWGIKAAQFQSRYEAAREQLEKLGVKAQTKIWKTSANPKRLNAQALSDTRYRCLDCKKTIAQEDLYDYQKLNLIHKILKLERSEKAQISRDLKILNRFARVASELELSNLDELSSLSEFSDFQLLRLQVLKFILSAPQSAILVIDYPSFAFSLDSFKKLLDIVSKSSHSLIFTELDPRYLNLTNEHYTLSTDQSSVSTLSCHTEEYLVEEYEKLESSSHWDVLAWIQELTDSQSENIRTINRSQFARIDEKVLSSDVLNIRCHAALRFENLASFLDLRTEIAKIYTSTPAARGLGLKNSDFFIPVGKSFPNCEICQGLSLSCPSCLGSKLHSSRSQIRYLQKRITDLYELPILDLRRILKNHKKISSILSCTIEFGLGHLSLTRTPKDLSTSETRLLNLYRLNQDRRKFRVLILQNLFLGLDPSNTLLVKRLVTEKLTDRFQSILIVDDRAQLFF